MSMQDEIRKELEKSSLEDTLTRIESLIAATPTVKPLHLGILLALRIAKEIRDGKDPGAESTALVTSWADEHGSEVIDEAVIYARHFLLKPQELTQQIASKLDSSKSESESDAEDSLLAAQYAAEDDADLAGEDADDSEAAQK